MRPRASSHIPRDIKWSSHSAASWHRHIESRTLSATGAGRPSKGTQRPSTHLVLAQAPVVPKAPQNTTFGNTQSLDNSAPSKKDPLQHHIWQHTVLLLDTSALSSNQPCDITLARLRSWSPRQDLTLSASKCTAYRNDDGGIGSEVGQLVRARTLPCLEQTRPYGHRRLPSPLACLEGFRFWMNSTLSGVATLVVGRMMLSHSHKQPFCV